MINSRLAISLVTAFIIAFAVHIFTILMIPYLAPQDVWTRLEKIGPVGGFYVLGAVKPGDSEAALFDPAVVMAVCRYDLGVESSFRITGEPSQWYWSLTLHNARGFAYYAANNRVIGDARSMDLRILTAEQYTAKQQQEIEEAQQEYIISSPTRRGYVVLRALVPEPSAREQVEQSIKTIGCQSHQEPI